MTELEKYRVRKAKEMELPEDQKIIILWDVYCRHRDACLKAWMQETFPHILVLFVPANLTEKGQPLDRWFNAVLKTLLASLRNERVLKAVTEHMKAEEERKKYVESQGEKYVELIYVPPTKLSMVKEPFFDDMATAINRMQTPQYKELLSENAWKHGLFEKVFDKDFQREAVKKVADDFLRKTDK